VDQARGASRPIGVGGTRISRGGRKRRHRNGRPRRRPLPPLQLRARDAGTITAEQAPGLERGAGGGVLARRPCRRLRVARYSTRLRRDPFFWYVRRWWGLVRCWARLISTPLLNSIHTHLKSSVAVSGAGVSRMCSGPTFGARSFHRKDQVKKRCRCGPVVGGSADPPQAGPRRARKPSSRPELWSSNRKRQLCLK
jgi:hypothetical protein